MSDEHDHSHEEPRPQAAGTPPPPGPAQEDAGSQALAEALRSSFFIVKGVMIVLVGVFLCSGFFMVGAQQRAIILRLGKPVQSGTNVLLGPGLHWAYPAPIDEVKKIPYTAQQTVKSTVGWYFTTPEMEASGQETMPGPLNPAIDGYVITADENIIHSRATLYYRVEDPVRYEFDFTNAAATVQNALDNALLFAASRFTADDMLTRQVTKFRETVQERVTELAQEQNLGIVVEQCEVQSMPPRMLTNAFNAVILASAGAESTKSAALGESLQIMGRAMVDAATITNAAETERLRLVESVKAEAKRFQDFLPRYKSNSLFESLLLSEKLAQVLTNVQDKFILPDNMRELRMQYNREPPAPKPAGSGPP